MKIYCQFYFGGITLKCILHIYFDQFWAVLREDDKKYLNWQNYTFDNRRRSSRGFFKT